jgi:hypothetical protein
MNTELVSMSAFAISLFVLWHGYLAHAFVRLFVALKSNIVRKISMFVFVSVVVCIDTDKTLRCGIENFFKIVHRYLLDPQWLSQEQTSIRGGEIMVAAVNALCRKHMTALACLIRVCQSFCSKVKLYLDKCRIHLRLCRLKIHPHSRKV